jgi:hypothetical protein
MKQIHEIFTVLIILYESTQIVGVLPPNILSCIVYLTEYVPRNLIPVAYSNDTFQLPVQSSCLREGKTRKEWGNSDTFSICPKNKCNSISTIFRTKMDAEQKHKELMEFLAANPDIAHSD